MMDKAERLPPGTIIGNWTCPCCKGKVKVKVNKNGMAYYYCNGGLPSNDPCSHHQKWGRAASDAMVEMYLKDRKGAADDQPADSPKAAPAAAVPPRRSAFDVLAGG